MKLILYNHYHIGDHYFSKPLVKAIRKYNPEIEIELCISCYDYVYSDIENINIGDNVLVSSKAFNPILTKI